MLAGANEELSEISYQYGRNLGLAFQLVDDLLDFVSSSAQMGKPTAADLKLGLATAPVLFACEKVCILINIIYNIARYQYLILFYVICFCFFFYFCFFSIRN